MAGVKSEDSSKSANGNKVRDPENEHVRDADPNAVEIKIGERNQSIGVLAEFRASVTETRTEGSESNGGGGVGTELEDLIAQHASFLTSENHVSTGPDFAVGGSIRNDTPQTRRSLNATDCSLNSQRSNRNGIHDKRDQGGNFGKEIVYSCTEERTKSKSATAADQQTILHDINERIASPAPGDQRQGGQNSDTRRDLHLNRSVTHLRPIGIEPSNSAADAVLMKGRSYVNAAKGNLKHTWQKLTSSKCVRFLLNKTKRALRKRNRCATPERYNDIEQGPYDEEHIKRYVEELGAALTTYGLLPHRLKDYIRETAKSQNIDYEFCYIPGSIFLSLNRQQGLTTQLTMTCHPQAIDLKKLNEAFKVYKEVLENPRNVASGREILKDIYQKRDSRRRFYLRIFAHGLGACSVGSFAFGARTVDLGPIFILGANLGIMQLYIAPRSEGFCSLFEIYAAFIASFLARALSSVMNGEGDSTFCFAAMVQSSIALILPGYTALCAALEIQSRQIVAGTSRLVYTIMLITYLGTGLYLGTATFDLMKPSSMIPFSCNTERQSTRRVSSFLFLQQRFFWMPMFAVCLALTNNAQWRDVPVMTSIALCGNQAHFWISRRIVHGLHLANIVASFVIGLTANLSSQLFNVHAAAAMLPALFVQVPSGIAAAGTLKFAVFAAAEANDSGSGIDKIMNGTQRNSSGPGQDQLISQWNQTSPTTLLFDVSIGMIAVAFEMGIGLYLSTLIIVDKIGKKHFT